MQKNCANENVTSDQINDIEIVDNFKSETFEEPSDNPQSENQVKHKCFVCEKEFNQFNLELHFLECQETTLKKPVSDSFKSEISLKEKAKNEQSRRKDPKNQHKCYSCGRAFESTKNLTWHILNCRSKELKSKPTKSNVEKTQKKGLKVNDFPPNQTSASGLYFCQYCQISFTQKQRLRVSLPDFI